MKIKYSENVIGCRIRDEIYLNPSLIKGSKLYEAILKHEKKHSNRFTKEDLKHDLINKELQDLKLEYWRFMIRHPRALLSYLPISKVGKYWGFDIPLTLFWVFAIGIIWLVARTI